MCSIDGYIKKLCSNARCPVQKLGEKKKKDIYTVVRVHVCVSCTCYCGDIVGEQCMYGHG